MIKEYCDRCYKQVGRINDWPEKEYPATFEAKYELEEALGFIGRKAKFTACSACHFALKELLMTYFKFL